MKKSSMRSMIKTLFLTTTLMTLLGCGVFPSLFSPKASATPSIPPTQPPISEPTLAPIPPSSLTGANVVAANPICRASLDGLYALRKNLKIPQHLLSTVPTRQDADFDPNQYFTILTHISMLPTYTLDFLYSSNGLGGHPQIYARNAAAAQFKTFEEYQQAVTAQRSAENAYTPINHDSDYLTRIQVDGSPQGYYQYVMMALLAGQFYLDWHANYNDTRILCGTGDLKLIDDDLGFFKVKLPQNVADASQTIDYTAGVLIGDDTVSLRVITFTKWGGFTENIFVVDKHSPYKVISARHIELIKYQVGIAF